jgi:hypothetical protein
MPPGSICAMNPKMPRPAAPEGANRATGSEFLGRSSNPQIITVDPENLTASLQRGLTLYIGKQEYSLRLWDLQRLLQDTFPFDDSYRRNQLIGPTALCAHWFCFTGRQHGLNHHYPATFLHELITTCFGLDYSDIPMDAVLAGLRHRGFRVERTKAKGLAPFNRAADIRSVVYAPAGDGGWIRITKLGARGIVPPIRVGE